MCVYSMVLDYYNPLFPKEWILKTKDSDSIMPLQELKKLMKEFNEALEAAKKVDRLTNQPDCEDPEKLKLLKRIAELEKQLKLEKKKNKNKKKY